MHEKRIEGEKGRGLLASMGMGMVLGIQVGYALGKYRIRTFQSDGLYNIKFRDVI